MVTTIDPLYPDSSAPRERALVGALSLRQHDPATIDEHRRMLGYFKMAEQLRTFVAASQPEPTPAERAALAAILLGGVR